MTSAARRAAADEALAPRTARAQGASLTTLHSFSGTDGANPNYDARLLQARDGNFYGTTYSGGTGGSGTFTWVNGDATDPTITVPIADEQLYNGDLTFTVSLLQPGGAITLGIPSQTTVTISDNDTPPQPTLTLTNPPDGLTIAQDSTLPLTANVSDPGVILDHVEFYAGTRYLGQVNAPGPYVLTVNAPDSGTYSITAVAIDTQERQSVSGTHALVVVPYNSNYVAPSVSILTDVNSRSLAVGSTLNLSVSAYNNDGSALQRVNFYADGVLFASFDGAGNVYPGTPRPPMHRDAFGVSTVFAVGLQLPGTSKVVNLIAVTLSQLGTAQISSPVSVQSVATADQPPQVAFNGAATASVHTNVAVTVPLTITDPATGGTDAAVTRVEFERGRQLQFGCADQSEGDDHRSLNGGARVCGPWLNLNLEKPVESGMKRAVLPHLNFALNTCPLRNAAQSDPWKNPFVPLSIPSFSSWPWRGPLPPTGSPTDISRP